MLILLPPLLWLGMMHLPPPQWARTGTPSLLYPYLLAAVWFVLVALIAGV